MIESYFQNHLSVVQKLIDSKQLVSTCEKVCIQLHDVLQSERKILIAGNGGSAADSQHFAAELVGRFKLERRGYPAIALTTDTSALTAIANDYGFVKVFSRQLEALGQPGDVLICISTSGNSENLKHAAVQAKKMGIATVGLLGKDGGVLREFVDTAVIVPDSTTSHIQEAHQIIYHAWCEGLDTKLTHD